MQIKRLSVNGNKCLDHFSIEMMINREQGSSTILIGENGTGKSTMLKTVLEILMSFDSPSIEENISYDYQIEYFYKGNEIKVSKSGRLYEIQINDGFQFYGTMKSFKKELLRIGKSIIPERINYFYSGANDQTLDIFKRININYNTDCRDQIVRYWNTIYLLNHDEYTGEFPKRKYNYCDEELVPVYLISILCGGNTYEKRCLQEQCHIGRIDSISVVINTRSLRNRLQNDITEIGVEGVYDLLNFIDDRFTECFRQGYIEQDREQFVFVLDHLEIIDADSVSFFNFFEKLITLLDANLNLRAFVGDIPVNCSLLSEGQRQLIKVLGMLGVCKSEDTLVLMDEPDAHMNPKWKYDLKEIIDACLEEAINTQAIIATHDPLVINGVDNQFIRIFVHDTTILHDNHAYITKVIEPTENTEGLGIDGLLQSEYYGLKTSYDRKTSDEFVRRQILYSKLINNGITDEEKDELRQLTKKIGSLPISNNSIDFLYDDFIQVYRNSELFSKEYLSYEEIQERRRKIHEIITALYEGQI